MGKARGTWLTPKRGDIPAKSWRIHPRPSRRGRDCCRAKSTLGFQWWDMKTLDEIRTIIKQNQDILAEKYGVAVVGVFGSYVRGEQKRQSDIDLLVDILHPISLLELVGAEIHLSEVLGLKVDLVPKRDVREELRETLFAEAIAI